MWCSAGSRKRTGLLAEKPLASALSLGWAALIVMMAKKGSAVAIPEGQPSLGQGPQLLCRRSLEGKAWGPNAKWSFFPALLCPTITCPQLRSSPNPLLKTHPLAWHYNRPACW